VAVHKITAKTILRKHKIIDSWFISRFGMNLYRGCQHNCSYCDGRAERYQVDGVFGRDIVVKVNAIDILRRELNPRHKRHPFTGYILLGGGVGDSYQQVERQYCLARKALKLIRDYRHPVHILTKSTLVERDIDIIGDIHDQRGAIVSCSFSSVDDRISAVFEPGVPPASHRLALLQTFNEAGIPVGMFLLPVIPYVTDSNTVIDNSVRAARDVGANFVICGVMTLKQGQQRAHFMQILKQNYPDLCASYLSLYGRDRWGTVTPDFHQTVNAHFDKAAMQYSIPKRVPPSLWVDLVTENEKVAIILEHLHYLVQLKGKSSSYHQAARSIHLLTTPVSQYPKDLTNLAGIGPVTVNLIQEIIETGNCSYYTSLLNG